MGFGSFNRNAAGSAATTPPAGPAPGGFTRTPASAPVAGGRAAPKSRWAGVQSAEPRLPMVGEGVYRLRVASCEQGFNPGTGTESFKANLEVVDAADGSANAPGDNVMVIELLSGKAMQSGMARTKAFIVAASGYDGDAEYDAFSPDGGHIDAVLGIANSYASQTIVGRLVDCRVSRGKPVKADAPNGDYYRIYEWAPVEEAKQEVPMPGAAPAGAA